MNGGGGTLGGGVNTPVCGGLGMFAVGDTDEDVDDGPVVVVAAALDVVVVVEVDGVLLPLLPQPAVNAPAAMTATAPAAAAMRPAFDPGPILRRYPGVLAGDAESTGKP